MKTIAMQLLDAALKLLMGALWRIVKTAVAAQEQTGLTGAQKQALVFSQIKSEAIAMGATLSDSLVNLAIEAAVQLVRRAG